MDLRPSLLLEMLKSFRTLLISVASTSTIASLLLFVAPTALKDDTIKSIFYSGGLLSGLSTIGLSMAINRYSPIFTILKKADDETFTHTIATYIYEQKQGINPDFDQLPVTDEPIDIYPEQLPDNVSINTSEQISASLITEVSKLVSEGKSDTFIIENVLQCKGRKYQEGKVKLGEIKELIAQLNQQNESNIDAWSSPG
ncbi:hypothetical protein ACP6PL_10355 [Dapis sp. BLCC M126]|uniref:hypothetical protein n=1 Tax=Dapis sp. BLCC M126 TaxID=3400189 RepID=UPI003CFBA0DF